MPIGKLFSVGILAAAIVAGAARQAHAQERPSQDAFDRLVADYRGDDSLRAVTTLAQWTEAQVNASTRHVDTLTDPSTMAAAALLLTESGIISSRFGRLAEGVPTRVMLGHWGLSKSFEVHSYRANQLVEALMARAKRTSDAALIDWVKHWYIVTASYCRAYRRPCTRGLVDKGLHALDNRDPDVLLWRGAMRETGRASQWRPLPIPPQLMSLRVLINQEAHWAYRRALNIDPMHVEARMRLGRSLHLNQNDPSATPILQQALTDALAIGHVFAAHLSALTLGEILEDHGRLADAVPYYRQAVDIHPGATARIALAQALVRTGQREAGWAEGRLLIEAARPHAPRTADPWLSVRLGLYWQAANRITLMHDAVKLPRS